MKSLESYSSPCRALNKPRKSIPLVTILLVSVCTACGSDGQSDAQQDGPDTTDPLPPIAGLSPLSDDKWESTLERVLEVVGGDTRRILFDAAVALRLPGTSAGTLEGIAVTEEPATFVLSDGSNGTQTTADCDAGGGFQLVTPSSDSGRALINADDCVLDSRTIDGRVERVTSATAVESLTFDSFSVEVDGQRVSVPAAVYETTDGHPVASTLWKGMSYSVENNSETTNVDALELEDVAIYGTAFDQSLSIEFTISGTWSGDQPLAVSTPVSFGGLTTSETGRDYTVGQMVVEADEANRLMLDVDSGESGLVLITLEREGVVTTHFWPWPDALR